MAPSSGEGPPSPSGTGGVGAEPPTARTLPAVAGYRVLRQLATEPGGATVYLAQHATLGEARELTLLDTPSAAVNQALLRERATAILDAGRVEHPGIARIVDAGISEDGRLFVAAERAAGVALQDYLDAHGALGAQRALRITLSVAEALEAAHASGVVHGELTPLRVRLAPPAVDRTEHVVVTGLGLRSHDWAGETRREPTKGDRPYAAPERQTGLPADPRSDVFSLASITLAALSGTPPPVVRTTALRAHDGAGAPDAEPSGRARPSVLHVLLRARAPNVARRYQTVAQFREALEIAAAGIWAAGAAPAPHPVDERSDAGAIPPVIVPAVRPPMVSTPTADAASTPAEVAPVAARPARPRPGRRRAVLALAAALVAVVLGVSLVELDPMGDAGEDRVPSVVAGGPTTEPARAPLALPPDPVAQPRTAPAAAIPSRAPVAPRAPAARVAPPPPRRAGEPIGRELSAAARDPATPLSAPSARPAAATPSADAGRSDVAVASMREGIDAAVSEYARAIEARDLGALRRAYPGMTNAQQRAWATFFRSVRDLRARLVVARVQGAGETALADVEGSYEYQNRRPSRAERASVKFRATLTREVSGWRILTVE